MNAYGRNYVKPLNTQAIIDDEAYDAKTEVLIKRQDEKSFINDFIHEHSFDLLLDF
jgi:hypothetical protein